MAPELKRAGLRVNVYVCVFGFLWAHLETSTWHPYRRIQTKKRSQIKIEHFPAVQNQRAIGGENEWRIEWKRNFNEGVKQLFRSFDHSINKRWPRRPPSKEVFEYLQSKKIMTRVKNNNNGLAFLACFHMRQCWRSCQPTKSIRTSKSRAFQRHSNTSKGKVQPRRASSNSTSTNIVPAHSNIVVSSNAHHHETINCFLLSGRSLRPPVLLGLSGDAQQRKREPCCVVRWRTF